MRLDLPLISTALACSYSANGSRSDSVHNNSVEQSNSRQLKELENMTKHKAFTFPEEHVFHLLDGMPIFGNMHIVKDFAAYFLSYLLDLSSFHVGPELQKVLEYVSTIVDPSLRLAYYSVVLKWRYEISGLTRSYNIRSIPSIAEIKLDPLDLSRMTKLILTPHIFGKNIEKNINHAPNMAWQDQISFNIYTQNFRKSFREQVFMAKWISGVKPGTDYEGRALRLLSQNNGAMFLHTDHNAIAVASIKELLELFNLSDKYHRLPWEEVIECSSFLHCESMVKRFLEMAYMEKDDISASFKGTLVQTQIISEQYMDEAIKKFDNLSKGRQESVYRSLILLKFQIISKDDLKTLQTDHEDFFLGGIMDGAKIRSLPKFFNCYLTCCEWLEYTIDTLQDT